MSEFSQCSVFPAKSTSTAILSHFWKPLRKHYHELKMPLKSAFLKMLSRLLFRSFSSPCSLTVLLRPSHHFVSYLVILSLTLSLLWNARTIFLPLIYHFLLSLSYCLLSLAYQSVSLLFCQFFFQALWPSFPPFSVSTLFLSSSLPLSLTFLSLNVSFLHSLGLSTISRSPCPPPQPLSFLIHIPPVSVSLELPWGIKSTFKFIFLFFLFALRLKDLFFSLFFFSL